MNRNLEKVILEFDNNYPALMGYSVTFSGVSVIVPYFESRYTINQCLESIIQSCVFCAQNITKTEVVVVDDGSVKYPAKDYINSNLQQKIKIFSLNKNYGRYYARNYGLKRASNSIVIFVDADVMVYPELIYEYGKVHTLYKSNNFNSVTFSLFNFLETNKIKDLYFDQTNDFRNYCVYQKSWKGCKQDEQFAGKEYKIIQETDFLRSWPVGGKLGPWVLPNMVLGGCFGVDRLQAVNVGGCSGMFGKYGFEETSLVTKLMAKYHTYLIPVIDRYPVHINDQKVSLTKEERDKLFRKTHRIYFEKYLKQTLDEALVRDESYFLD